jgi:AraC-like DNA-binding protein
MSVSIAAPYEGVVPRVLYDPAVAAVANSTDIRAWKPGVAGIREVLHARFKDHAYPLHTHDVWTLMVVDDGAVTYALDGRPRSADGAMVTLLPPHVVHDGRPATARGFRKRVLYLETSILGEELIGPAVDQPVVPGDGLRDRVSALHDALACVDDSLEAEMILADVTDRIGAALGAMSPERALAPTHDQAEQLRWFLDAHLFEAVTLAAASASIGETPARLARSFSTVFGLAPHAYVLGRRLEAARDRILRGQALADVAAEVGFYDQAHLSHRFKQVLGTTPGQFRRGSAH